MEQAIQKQIEIEKLAHANGIIKATIQLHEAQTNMRASELPPGKIFMVQNQEKATQLIEERMVTKKRGKHAKYGPMMTRIDCDKLAALGLRTIYNFCSQEIPPVVQDVLRHLGDAIASEYIISIMADLKPAYLDVMKRQMEQEKVSSAHHIRQKFDTAMLDMDELDVEPWSSEERVGCATYVLSCLEPLNLYHWSKVPSGKGRPFNCMRPTPHLLQYITEVEATIRPNVEFPVMLVQPRPWKSMYDGGYYTEELQTLAPMVVTKGMSKQIRKWITQNISEGKAEELKAAMNAAQNVPYRVNKQILAIAQEAFAVENGALGLPPHVIPPKPEWPLPADFDPEYATKEELNIHAKWKKDAKLWYQNKDENIGRKVGYRGKLRELISHKDYEKFYFPTFLDWRGRMYFKSYLNPQASDMVKGCLEFAEGYELGERGLFWLKVHVANCAGFDKKDFPIRAQWTDDNLDMIRHCVSNPLDHGVPEDDTAFTFIQAAMALLEALELPDPTKYVCHVPVAMDATCSGLQHWSAMLRDEQGGKFTNLIDPAGDEKEDIYKQVKNVATPLIDGYCKTQEMRDYWKEHEITRSMAKRPVMTYVYSATLLSCVEYLDLDMRAAGWPEGSKGTPRRHLAQPAGRALRYGVETTVPKAVIGMAYLRKLVKQKDEPLSWFSPAGMPVTNWSNKAEVKYINLLSLNLSTMAYRCQRAQYDRRAAGNGISPNFIHSMDSAHLCKTINAFGKSILPIHDSFACHPCNVDLMHAVLRDEFIKMYEHFDITSIAEFNGVEGVEPPSKGNLNLESIRTSRFVFC